MASLTNEEIGEIRGILPEQVGILRDRFSLTESDFINAPDRAIEKMLRKLEGRNSPLDRQNFRLMQDSIDGADPQRTYHLNALKQLDSLRLRTPRTTVAGMSVGGAVPAAILGPNIEPLVAGLEGAHWNPIGPTDVGGRTRSILIDPANPDILYAGSTGGGLWRSADAGANWSPVDDFMANLAVTTICAEINSSGQISRLYAGTGEGFNNIGNLRGGGIFTSQDGVSWTGLASSQIPNFQRINRLAVNNDNTILYAATNTGLYISDDAARSLWQRVLPNRIAQVVCHPTDSTQALATSLRDGIIWRTQDSGQTWTQATHANIWSGRIEVCYASADPNIIYASVNVELGQIWRSSDGGTSFVKRDGINFREPKNYFGNPNYARFLDEQGWYDNCIWAGDPTNSEVVIVGGVDLWHSDDGGNLLRTISTWWSDDSAHADQHAIISHPNFDGENNRTVYFGNDGGIYRADDINNLGHDLYELVDGVKNVPPFNIGWEDLNNGYAVTQFYGGAVDQTTGVIVCGAQDNGTLAYNPDTGIWSKIKGGDGGFCAAENNGTVFYGEYVNLQIFRNTNGAADDSASEYICGSYYDAATGKTRWKSSPYLIPEANTGGALFIAPFVVDPNKASTILAGGASLWKTDDADAVLTTLTGPKWRSIKTSSLSLISTIEIDSNNSDNVWIGHAEGQVYFTKNAQAHNPVWNFVNSEPSHVMSSNRFVHDIYISVHDSNNVFVVLGRYVSGNIFRTLDFGTTWTQLGLTLPEAPIRAITGHPNPTRRNWIYVGTEVGVFGSEDNGVTWSPVNEGPANVSVDDLIWNRETLICITHGRGVYTIDLSVPRDPIGAVA